jgi:hypothetical protein
MQDPLNLKYILQKDKYDLTNLKEKLEDKIKTYRGWLVNFPVELDNQEQLLRTDLRLLIVELNSELMGVHYRLRDIDCELSNF